MDPELKKLLDELGSRFEAFKAQHTTELKELKDKGAVSAETATAVAKANAAITECQATIAKVKEESAAARKAAETLETELARQSGRKDAIDGLRAAAQSFFAMVAQRRRQPAPAGEPDVTRYEAYRNAFFEHARIGPDACSPEIKAALVVGTDQLGGFLYPTDTGGRIAELAFESSPFRQYVSVQATDADSLTGFADLDETDSGWSSEQGTRADHDTPDLGGWKIPVHEIYAQPKASNRSLDMRAAFNVEAWLTAKVGSRLARREANAMVLGDGIVKPRGFMTYPAGTPSASTWNVIQRTKTGADGAFVAAPNSADFLMDLIYSLKAAYRANARFAAPRLVYAALRKLKDSDGQYLWQPGLSAGAPDRLLGYEAFEAEDIAAITTDSLSLAFADWKEAYQLVENPAIRLIRDNVTAKGWVKFFNYTYRGGDVVNFEAIKLVQWGD